MKKVYEVITQVTPNLTMHVTFGTLAKAEEYVKENIHWSCRDTNKIVEKFIKE